MNRKVASCLHLNFHAFPQLVLPTVLLLRLLPANADKSRNMFIVVAQRFSLCKPTTTATRRTTSFYTRVAYKTNIDFVAVVVVVVAAAALLLLLLLRLFMLMELPLLMMLLLLVAQPQLMVLGNAVVPLTAAAGQNFAAHVLSCLTRICILYARPVPLSPCCCSLSNCPRHCL